MVVVVVGAGRLKRIHFETNPINTSLNEYSENGKKVCILSSDLHAARYEFDLIRNICVYSQPAKQR